MTTEGKRSRSTSKKRTTRPASFRWRARVKSMRVVSRAGGALAGAVEVVAERAGALAVEEEGDLAVAEFVALVVAAQRLFEDAPAGGERLAEEEGAAGVDPGRDAPVEVDLRLASEADL